MNIPDDVEKITNANAEQILGVAIIRFDGPLMRKAKPARHADIIADIRATGGEPTIDDQFGFYTIDDDFITREQAGSFVGLNRPLYSENLW